MTQGRKTPTPVLKANTQNVMNNSNGQKGRVGFGGNKTNHMNYSVDILNLRSKTNS